MPNSYDSVILIFIFWHYAEQETLGLMPCKQGLCIGSGVRSLVQPFIPSVYQSNYQLTHAFIFIHPTMYPPIYIHPYPFIHPHNPTIYLTINPSTLPYQTIHPPPNSYPTISIHWAIHIQASIHARTSTQDTLCQAWSLLINETQLLTLRSSCPRSPYKDIYSTHGVESMKLHSFPSININWWLSSIGK